MQTKTFKIGGFDIKVSFDEENKAAKYFDFKKYESNWHDKKTSVYHLTQLLQCIKMQWIIIKYDLEQEDRSLETLGNFFLGHVLHKEIQEYIEKTLGAVIIERPMIDEVDMKFTDPKTNTEFEDVIFIVGKADIIEMKQKHYGIDENILGDIKTTRYMPILETLDDPKFEEKFGLYIIQVLALTYYLNHTYFKVDPIDKLKLIYVHKADCYTKEIFIAYDDKVAKEFYIKIRERAKYLHTCIMLDTEPKAELNQYCPSRICLGYCSEGQEYAESLKEPVSFESVEFKKKYPDKLPYIKRNGEWKETSLFVKFKDTLKLKGK